MGSRRVECVAERYFVATAFSEYKAAYKGQRHSSIEMYDRLCEHCR